MRSMDAFPPLMQAAIFDIGCNPFVVLIVTIIVVGIIMYFADALVGALPMKDPWKALALKAIYALGIIYTVCVALEILFGITIINVSPIACG